MNFYEKTKRQRFSVKRMRFKVNFFEIYEFLNKYE